MGTKVLLVDPPRKFWDVFRFHTASCGLASIAGYLESKGHEVVIADLYGLDSSWEELENILKREKPQVVGITCTVVSSTYDAIHCAMLTRLICPDAKIVGGGFTFTAIPEDFLSTGYFDYVCIGEGEITFAHLLEVIEGREKIENVLGVAYVEGREIKKNPHRPFIENLDDLPMPAWHLFPMDRYSIRPMGGNIAFAITNSRGCVNRCSFCSEALLWRSQYRSFSAEWICNNLELLIGKYKKTVYIFGDNDFLYDRERLINFCDEMERRKIKAYFWIEASVRSTLRNKDLLPRLRQVGGFNIQMGIETVSPEVLKVYNKPQNLKEMEEAIKVARDAGISVTGLFIWGDWHDTLETLKAGVSFINRHADFIAPSLINPFPGTPYYKMCKEAGRIKEYNLWKYNQHHVVMELNGMSMEEAQELYEKNAYSIPVLLNMVYQALFSPYRPARMWAWEFMMLDIKFLFPHFRKPGGELFEDYMERTGRKVPPWTFPYPKKSVKPEKRIGYR